MVFEGNVSERNARALLLDALSRDLTSLTHDIDRLLDRALERLGSHFNGTSALRITDDGEWLARDVLVSNPDPITVALVHDFLRKQPHRVGDGFTGRIIALDAPLLVTRFSDETVLRALDAAGRAFIDTLGIRSIIGAPLRSPTGAFGAVIIARTAHRPVFTDDDAKLLQEAVDLVSDAITRARAR
ncbi:MAG: GAF domain-containing protein [Archangium sp.]|nr:GAF domain-containing protein [Archangium sp.]